MVCTISVSAEIVFFSLTMIPEDCNSKEASSKIRAVSTGSIGRNFANVCWGGSGYNARRQVLKKPNLEAGERQKQTKDWSLTWLFESRSSGGEMFPEC